MNIAKFVLFTVCTSTSAATAFSASSQGGFVQAPGAGSTPISLDDVPAGIRHAAQTALKGYDAGYKLTGAQMDFDEISAVYEIQAVASNGRALEVDVALDGTILEIEIEVPREEVPPNIISALNFYLPTFEASNEVPSVEKSLRTSTSGLLEVWYEFSGTNYDVEIRSDSKALLIEPA